MQRIQPAIYPAVIAPGEARGVKLDQQWFIEMESFEDYWQLPKTDRKTVLAITNLNAGASGVLECLLVLVISVCLSVPHRYGGVTGSYAISESRSAVYSAASSEGCCPSEMINPFSLGSSSWLSP